MRERQNASATGEPALYLGRRRNSYVEGLPHAESDALLDELWQFVDSPQFIYEHRWCVGDLVVWDNWCSIHARKDFPREEPRLMRRCTIEGQTLRY